MKTKPLKKFPLVAVLDNVRSLYNVGAIFRTCDGAGVDKLYLTGITGYPTQSKRAQRQIEKTALSTVPYVNWEHEVDIAKILKKLKKDGYQIVVLEQTAKSIEYSVSSIKYNFPIALVVGHETIGVSKEAIGLADFVVHIPMQADAKRPNNPAKRGHAKSLNVATAAGIMLYYLRSLKP